MPYIRLKTRVVSLVFLIALLGLATAFVPVERASADDNKLDLPSPLCDRIEAPAGNRLIRRIFAQGVQLYRWNGTSWAFVEPVATLYSDANFHDKVGIHYLGPTWEHNDGSKVVATRVDGCTPDATAIPWLLLQKVTTDGNGQFGSVSYIQRINTKGGIVPTAPGVNIGSVAEVPYTAEYLFYRPSN